MTVATELARLDVRVRIKSESWLMRAIGCLLGRKFLERYWTTVSGSTIWAPIGTDLSRLDQYRVVIHHELVHVMQARRWPVLWQLSYLLLPLPVGLAYFRWRSERAAYLVDLRAGRVTVERVVQSLWSVYGWTWPRGLMRRWFLREMDR